MPTPQVLARTGGSEDWGGLAGAIVLMVGGVLVIVARRREPDAS